MDSAQSSTTEASYEKKSASSTTKPASSSAGTPTAPTALGLAVRHRSFHLYPHPNLSVKGQYTNQHFPMIFFCGTIPHERESQLLSVLSPMARYSSASSFRGVISSGKSGARASLGYPICCATKSFTCP